MLAEVMLIKVQRRPYGYPIFQYPRGGLVLQSIYTSDPPSVDELIWVDTLSLTSMVGF